MFFLSYIHFQIINMRFNINCVVINIRNIWMFYIHIGSAKLSRPLSTNHCSAHLIPYTIIDTCISKLSITPVFIIFVFSCHQSFKLLSFKVPFKCTSNWWKTFTKTMFCNNLFDTLNFFQICWHLLQKYHHYIF